MRYSSDQKSTTRERIVRNAAEQFRARGLNGIGVADLMKAAGLTHGGFYAHFESREELVIEAIGEAFSQTREQLQQAAAQAGSRNKSRAIREQYLTAAHRDNPQRGCAIAALGSDVARLGTGARRRFESQVKALLDLLADADETSQQQAMRTLSAMVGALVLARAVNSKSLSNDILDAVRNS